MSLSSPVCYLGTNVSDSDWEGPAGGAQWVIRERWTLDVEPRAGIGWVWTLRAEGPSELVGTGVVPMSTGVDAEAEAKRRAVQALSEAQQQAPEHDH